MNQPAPVKLTEEYKCLNDVYPSLDVLALETTTRAQANCPEWFQARKSRITASKFGSIVHRVKRPTEPFFKKIFGENDIRSCSTEYGKRNELNAKARYMELYPTRHFHDCGLVVNPEFMFLGATPDGKLCSDGESGIVEIKCPWSARNCTIDEACVNTKFYLEKNNLSNITLKKDHEYFAQIQGQLMVTGADFCEFIVFTSKDIFVQRILPDVTYMEDTLLPRLSEFFLKYGHPYLKGCGIL